MSRSPLSKHEQPCPPGEAPPVTFGDTPGDSRLRRGFLGLAWLPGSGCGTLPGPRDLRLLRLPGAAGSVAARAGASLHESLGPGSSPSRRSRAVRPLSLCLFVCLFLSVKKKIILFVGGGARGQSSGRRQAPWRGQAGCRTGTVAAAAGSRPWGQRSPLLPLATLFSRLRPSGWPLPGDCASFPQPPTPVSLLGASPTADTWARPHTASQLPTPGKTPGVPPGPGMAHAREEGGRRERCGHGHPGRVGGGGGGDGMSGSGQPALAPALPPAGPRPPCDLMAAQPESCGVSAGARGGVWGGEAVPALLPGQGRAGSAGTTGGSRDSRGPSAGHPHQRLRGACAAPARQRLWRAGSGPPPPRASGPGNRCVTTEGRRPSLSTCPAGPCWAGVADGLRPIPRPRQSCPPRLLCRISAGIQTSAGVRRRRSCR